MGEEKARRGSQHSSGGSGVVVRSEAIAVVEGPGAGAGDVAVVLSWF